MVVIDVEAVFTGVSEFTDMVFIFGLSNTDKLTIFVVRDVVTVSVPLYALIFELVS